MIHLTDTSFISAVLFFIAALGVIMYLRRQTKQMEGIGAFPLVTAFILAGVRLFLPICLPFSIIISIPTVWPKVSLFFRGHPYIWLVFLIPWAIVAVSILAYDASCIYYTRLYYRSCIPVRRTHVEQVAKGLGITCPVVISHDVPGSCVVGIFRHTIYLSVADTVSEKRVEMVLKHESWHIRSFHNEIKALFNLVSALLWPFMIPLYFRKELEHLLELHCDENVFGHMDQAERYLYAETLLHSGRDMVGTASSYAPPGDRSSFLEEPDPTEQRFGLLFFRLDKAIPKLTVKMGCFMAAVFVASYLVMFEPGITPSSSDFDDPAGNYFYDSYSGFYDPNPEEDGTFLFKRTDGRYELCINYEFSKYLSQDEVDSEKYKGIPVYYEEGINP